QIRIAFLEQFPLPARTHSPAGVLPVARVKIIDHVQAFDHFAQRGKSVAVLPGLISRADVDLGGAGARSGHRISEGAAHIARAYGVVREALVAPDLRDSRIAGNAELREAAANDPVETGVVIEARLN